jgi:hypothetical protein
MKIGDLVQSQGYDTVKGRIGIVMRIDKDHFAARQAFKMSPRQLVERVTAADPNIVKRIELGRTAICDRVLVMFRDGVTPEYFRSTEFKVVSEG